MNIVRDLGLFCCVHMRACVDPYNSESCRYNSSGTRTRLESLIRNRILAQGHSACAVWLRTPTSHSELVPICPGIPRAARRAIAHWWQTGVVLTTQPASWCSAAVTRKTACARTRSTTDTILSFETTIKFRGKTKTEPSPRVGVAWLRIQIQLTFGNRSAKVAVRSSSTSLYRQRKRPTSEDLRFTGYQPYLAEELGKEGIQQKKRWRLMVQDQAPADTSNNDHKKPT